MVKSTQVLRLLNSLSSPDLPLYQALEFVCIYGNVDRRMDEITA